VPTKFLQLLFFFGLSLNAIAGQKAVTDDGQVVILNDDQTWQFVDSMSNEMPDSPLNKKKFAKMSAQVFKVNLLPTTIGIYINPKKWTFSKDKDNTNRLSFRTKNSVTSDLYAMVIPEGIEIAPEALAKIALENATEAAADAKIVKKEYRYVNGSKVLYMVMEGTIESIKFKYVGYYASNKSGTVQLIVYSSPDIVSANMPEIEEFLNGLVVN
jgi:hypothetical protein